MSPRPSQSRTIRRWSLILYWITIFMLTHWPEIDRYEPATGWPIPHFELIMHLTTYAGWAVMWWWFLSVDGRRVTPAMSTWIVLGGMAYAAFDELTQAIVDRTPAINDFLADVIAVFIATSICQLWQRSRHTGRFPPHGQAAP